jgi:hypothetical protein
MPEILPKTVITPPTIESLKPRTKARDPHCYHRSYSPKKTKK